MKKVFLSIIFLSFFSAAAQVDAGEIAITIDDLPYVTPSKVSPEEGMQIVLDIEQALSSHAVVATGFVVGRQVTRKTSAALEAFVAGGHALGNHGWSHTDVDELSKRQFQRELQKTHRVINRFVDGNTQAEKFFRFPYLREGSSEKIKSGAAQVLDQFGYTNARVTIDNDEWRFNQLYQAALENGELSEAQRVSDEYIEHMKEQTKHFQRLAKRQFGREVPHILLVHMNKINADHLHRLLTWYKHAGWEFVTLDSAIQDPIYSLPDQYIGPRGVSHLERLQ